MAASFHLPDITGRTAFSCAARWLKRQISCRNKRYTSRPCTGDVQTRHQYWNLYVTTCMLWSYRVMESSGCKHGGKRYLLLWQKGQNSSKISMDQLIKVDEKTSMSNIIHVSYLCIRQRKPWTPPPQGSTQIRRRNDVESWGVYFQGLVNLDLINFLTMWIFTLCESRPGESWTNVVYIASENVLNTKIDCSKNVLLIVVLVEYKLKWMCC